VLGYIKDFVRTAGYPPTVRELCAALGMTSTNAVNDHLKALERKGLISRDRRKGRGIRIVDRPSMVSDFGHNDQMVPLYEMSRREQVGHVRPPATLSKSPSADLAVRVAGNSARAIGIIDGDTLFLSRSKVQRLKSGDVVVVRVDDFLVVRRVIVDGLTRQLVPVSDTSPSIIFKYGELSKDVGVGVVVAVHRQLTPMPSAAYAM